MKKRNMFNLLATFVIFFIIYSCNKQENILEISAKIKNVSEGTLFTLTNLDSGKKLDSAIYTNGSLKLKSKLISDYPEHLRLTAFDKEKNHFLFTDFLVSNEKIYFDADASDFPWQIDVKGSIYQDEKEKFHKLLYERDSKREKLNQNSKSLNNKEINKLKDEIKSSINQKAATLIKKMPNTWASLKAFHHYKEEFTIKELEHIFNSLNEDLKSTKEAKAILTQIKYPKPEIGNKFYDYTAINQKGSETSISDFNGKYRLLHFSSKWCYGSQLSLTELKENYKKYKSNFEVIAISIDIKKTNWLDGVNKDSIKWNYLWDGKGIYNEANVKYWKTGTPWYVLIAPDGTILEDWFGYRKGEISTKLSKHIDFK